MQSRLHDGSFLDYAAGWARGLRATALSHAAGGPFRIRRPDIAGLCEYRYEDIHCGSRARTATTQLLKLKIAVEFLPLGPLRLSLLLFTLLLLPLSSLLLGRLRAIRLLCILGILAAGQAPRAGAASLSFVLSADTTSRSRRVAASLATGHSVFEVSPHRLPSVRLDALQCFGAIRRSQTAQGGCYQAAATSLQQLLEPAGTAEHALVDPARGCARLSAPVQSQRTRLPGRPATRRRRCRRRFRLP